MPNIKKALRLLVEVLVIVFILLYFCGVGPALLVAAVEGIL